MNFGKSCVRVLDEIARASHVGLVLSAVLALPLTLWVLDGVYSGLSQTAMSRLQASAQASAGAVHVPFDSQHGLIVQERIGQPFLCTLPLDASKIDAQLSRDDFTADQRVLLARYRARVLQASSTTERPATAKEPYRVDHTLIEVVLERDQQHNCRVVADIAFQSAPGHWQRIPWWEKEGIATNNQLLQINRDRFIPALRRVSTPTTIESLSFFVKDYWLPTVMQLNAEYASDTILNVRPKDFEKAIVHTLMRVMKADFSGLSVQPHVFLLATVCGPLQMLMAWLFFTGLIALVARVGMYRLVVREQRALRVMSKLLREQGLSTAAIYAEQRTRSLAYCSIQSPGCAGIIALGETKHPHSAAYDAIDRAAHSSRLSSMMGELDASIVFLGMLGTLLYLALSILQLRIHPSPAVMQSILVVMATQMAQAFLTTVMSSTLQRVLATLRAAALASEDRWHSRSYELVAQASQAFTIPTGYHDLDEEFELACSSPSPK